MKNPEIKEIQARLERGMIDYIKAAQPAYDRSDVVNCMQLITVYLDEIEQAESREQAMNLVKRTVLSLNDLNEKCEDELIETDQREDIAEIIILAAHLKGFNASDEDITEEWRAW
ncbi:hypothetical protein CLV84_0105 [Neolewinella xylanilytica]|uniref:Uncharacterized protein n=1 Tax=Neolewinella xylanilytica TaxID=1514080 RepID=A0A2S6I6S0_9BACT|nr:hypothetical protein [Neolewinella xylanilytica]PPK87170.1 hypothetical protein CLV84_0105 [Neolewinella xylanilytica]